MSVPGRPCGDFATQPRADRIVGLTRMPRPDFPSAEPDRFERHAVARWRPPVVACGRGGGACPNGVARGVRGGQPSWHDPRRRRPIPVLRHQRVQGVAHSGNGCEWLQLQADSGSLVYFAHDIGRPRVIDELAAERVGQVGPAGCADWPPRIVLPRSIDRQTGRALTTILIGGSYTDAGRWQQLRMEGIPRPVDSQGPRLADAARPAS